MSVIRTDRWQLNPHPQQRLWMERTIVEYRAFVRAIVGVIYTHWSQISIANAPLQEVERLVHRTQKNPDPRYAYFGQRFHKFLSHYRRAAINNAIGQVSSFVTRYGCYNIGDRPKLGSRNDSEVQEGERFARTPRILVTLSTLWDLSSQYRGVDTPLKRRGVSGEDS